ncbi:MAG TPA: SwmB domain-containing protein [Candidatus Paceibacterota bacterium]|nr:SwmB domain-containing protein [Candidatus Paceibacterota bacterium]
MKKSRLRHIFTGAAIFAIAAISFFAFRSYAAPTTYYFNNAVDTSPATQGNYWLDSGHTTPAVTLPNLGEDYLFVAAGSTYTGNAVFRGSALNEGTVTGDADFYDSSANLGTVNGDATFWEDLTENNAAVLGEQIRRYTAAYGDTYLYRDYSDEITTYPWVVIADGVELDLVAAFFDETTIFRIVNGGSFVYANLLSAMAIHSTLTLDYDKTVSTGSVPATTDFVVTVNGSTVSVTNVAISGRKVVLTLATPVVIGDTISIDYTVGSNPIITDQIPVPELNDQVVFYGVQTSLNPLYSVLVGTKLYTSNLGSNIVSVVDTVTDIATAEAITVNNTPGMPTTIGHKIYQPSGAGDSVYVINETNNTIIGSPVAVGDNPYFTHMFGTKLYVPNQADGTVSVIDTATDTETSINTGFTPVYAAAVGTKLYVVSRQSNRISVIDMETDTLLTTINYTSGGPNFARAFGTKLYVSSTGGNTVKVIDTTTDTIATTITVGTNPGIITNVGNKMYIGNFASDNVSVVDTSTDTVIATISVGDEPNYLSSSGNLVFVPNRLGNTVSVIDSTTDTVVDTLNVGTYPIYAFPVGNKIYVNHTGASGISIFDISKLPHLLPNLTSFSSATADGTYTEGDAITITANFGKTLASGSTMTVTLNTGASVVLNNRSGSTLSGTYTVGAGEETPDLAVTAISSASVTDGTNTRTSYEVPSSPGSLTAEKSMLKRNLGDVKNIVIEPFSAIEVGTNPYQVSGTVTVGAVDYIYVANQGSDDVSVIRLSDNTVVDTIDVGSEPYGLTLVEISGTTYVYVANTGSDTVSVINTDDNSIEATISVGVKPYYVEHIGTDVYITNGASNTVSVVDANTNTLTDTISVGSYPRGIKAHGTDLYVANYGDHQYSGGNYISVIDSGTNTVTDTIILPSSSEGPRGVTVLGSKVYVANYLTHNVSVINTATNAVTATIAVGNGPRGMAAVGTDIYVENFDDGTISVIDSTNNTVTDTIDVGHSPAGMGVVGTDIYFSRFQDNTVSILDTTTNTVVAGLPILTTEAASGVTATGATLNGTITAGEATTQGFEYGPTTSYGTTVSSIGSFVAGAFDEILSGLSASSTYHARSFATNDFGTGYGNDISFTTSAASSGGGSVAGGGSIPLPVQPTPPTTPPVVPPINPDPVTPDPNQPQPETPPATPEALALAFKQTYPTLFVESKNLKTGMTSKAIFDLQKYLNTHGFIVSKTGAGSPGKETSFFGAATRAAITKFQEAHAKEILIPVGLKKGTGIFGPSTKKYILLHP